MRTFPLQSPSCLLLLLLFPPHLLRACSDPHLLRAQTESLERTFSFPSFLPFFFFIFFFWRPDILLHPPGSPLQRILQDNPQRLCYFFKFYFIFLLAGLRAMPSGLERIEGEATTGERRLSLRRCGIRG